MKKLLFFIFALNINLVFSQAVDKHLIFDDIRPLWIHQVVDSSRLEDTLYYGTGHIFNWRKNIIQGDSIAYMVFVDQSNTLQGAYLEKIDLRSGNVIWHNVFNERTLGVREYPDYVYINEVGNLELLCFRQLPGAYLPGWGWFKAQLSIREYNAATGELLRYDFNNNVEGLSEDEKLDFFVTKTFLIPDINGRYNYYNPSTNNVISKFIYSKKTFDNNTHFIKSDTVYREKKYCCSSFQQIVSISRDTILTARHMHKQLPSEPLRKENFDTFKFVVDLYNSEFDTIKSYYNMAQYIPYNWLILTGYDKEGYILVASNDSIKTNNEKRAYSYFYKDGSHYETLDFKKENLRKLSIRKLPNEDGFLVITGEDSANWNVKRKLFLRKSDGHGNIERLKTVSFDSDKRTYRINSLDILRDNTIILGMQLLTMDANEPNKILDKSLYIVAIKGSDFGLLNTDDDLSNSDFRIILYPNPAQDILKVSVENILKNSTIEVYDKLGRKLLSRDFGTKTMLLDIATLHSGIYTVNIVQNGEVKSTKQFVKIDQ